MAGPYPCRLAKSGMRCEALAHQTFNPQNPRVLPNALADPSLPCQPSAGEINADRSAGLDTGKQMSGGGQAVDAYEARRDVYKEVTGRVTGRL